MKFFLVKDLVLGTCCTANQFHLILCRNIFLLIKKS